MLDINFIRDNADLVKKGMQAKGETEIHMVNDVLAADEQWRNLVHETDTLRSESNAKAKEIGQLMGSGKREEAQQIIEHTSRLKEEIKKHEGRLIELKEKRDQLLLHIPNVPHQSVPIGKNEKDNEVFKTWGKIDDVEKKPHWDFIEEKGWIDFKRGAKVTGAGFPFYKGPVAKLQRALINYFLDNAIENGFIEIQPPYLVNEDSARGTGQIPDKEDMMYEIQRDGFFNIPTGEVPVTNFHRDEIFENGQLPINYVAYTPCWRREAGSYGKDVRGLNRLHQFDKVEIVKIVDPDTSYDELENLREYAESLLEALGLPYRTLLMCTGDMGFTQTKKYDLEVWSPGQKRWLEVSSCSNFESFQARRMQIRFRNEDGNIEIAHTLNGSALALPRILAAILEKYQTADDNIQVPAVLQRYTGFEQF